VRVLLEFFQQFFHIPNISKYLLEVEFVSNIKKQLLVFLGNFFLWKFLDMSGIFFLHLESFNVSGFFVTHRIQKCLS